MILQPHARWIRIRCRRRARDAHRVADVTTCRRARDTLSRQVPDRRRLTTCHTPTTPAHRVTDCQFDDVAQLVPGDHVQSKCGIASRFAIDRRARSRGCQRHHPCSPSAWIRVPRRVQRSHIRSRPGGAADGIHSRIHDRGLHGRWGGLAPAAGRAGPAGGQGGLRGLPRPGGGAVRPVRPLGPGAQGRRQPVSPGARPATATARSTPKPAAAPTRFAPSRACRAATKRRPA